MTILSGFQKASFRGVQFYVRAATNPELGRKTAVHEYINAGRFVEDLGKKLGVFTEEAEVMDITWSAYNRKKRKLEEALATPGIGTLIHPTYGRRKVVVTGSNQVAENYINDLNCAKYSLTFYESDNNIFPTTKDGNKNFINRIFDTIFGENQTVLADSISFYNQGIEVFNDARDTIEELTSDINDVVSTINGTVDEVAAFAADISAFQASLTELMQTPSNLASRFTQIFNNISVITDNFENLFNVSLNLVGIGNNRIPRVGNSTRTATINSNKNAVYSFNDVAAVALAYEVATNLTYTNQEQLDNIQNRLNDAFNSVDPDLTDSTIYYNLQDIRNQVRLYLDTIRLNLAKIVTLRTNTIPSTILAFNLYGDTSRADEIITLNDITNPAFVSGIVNVLSQ